MAVPTFLQNIQAWRLSLSFSAAVALLCVIIFAAGGFGEEALLVVLRVSARLSMLAFLLAFAASSLFYFWPGKLTGWLRQQRRYWGVAFAITFMLHGLAIGLRVVLFPEGFVDTLDSRTLNVGGFSFVLALLMGLTSSNTAQRLLGPLWKGLHWFGNYYIFFMFISGEVLRIQEQPAVYVPYGVLLALVFLLRVAARLSKVFSLLVQRQPS